MSRLLRGHRTLVVEDDPEAAEDLRKLVESLGHSVRVACTVEEALIALEEETFCLYLIDQQLPAKVGMEASLGGGECILTEARRKDERLRGRFHVTPIIVITAYSSHEDFIGKMFDLGASAFMSKPIHGNFERLLDKIRTVLERAGRAHHADCAACAIAAPVGVAVAAPAQSVASAPAPAASPTSKGTVRLTLDGRRNGRRVGFLVHDKRCELTDSQFLFFLKVVVAYLREPGAWSTLADLGAADHLGLPSRICAAFVGFVPDDFLILERNGVLGYRLNPLVVVDVDWLALQSLGDEAVARVAREGARGR